jgi:hypothetical protein
MLRARQRSQSVVEFGIIAILFTLLLFAIADFGLLLNDWLSVSSGARQLARDAAVGVFPPDLVLEAKGLKIAGVDSTDPSALQLNVTFYGQCLPGPSAPGCSKVSTAQLDKRYSSDGVQGTCDRTTQPGGVCPHPVAPGPPPPPAGTGTCTPPPGPTPTCPGDGVVLTLTAAKAQVITPLVRPFFTNPSTCASTSAHCYVALSSSVTMRFEGDTL